MKILSRFFIYFSILFFSLPVQAVDVSNASELRTEVNSTPSGGNKAIDVTAGLIGDSTNPFIALSVSNKTLNISSALSGGSVFDAANSVSFFNISGGSTVNFNGISFHNAFRNSNGGAILLANSNLNFSGETTFSNSNTNGSGGAISSNSASSVVFNGKANFLNNHAATSGGALSVGGNWSFKDDTLFSGNIADSYGGAMLAASNSTLTFDKAATFSNNRSAFRGGSVWVGRNTNLTFSGSTQFTGNSSGDYGGALFLDYGTVNFNGNTIAAGNNAANQRGGALYSNNGTFNFTSGGYFSNNTDRYGSNDVYLGGNDGGSILNISGTQALTFASGLASNNSSKVFNTGSGVFTAEISKFLGTYTQQNEINATSFFQGDTVAAASYNINSGTADFNGHMNSALNIGVGASATLSGTSHQLLGSLTNNGTLGISGSITNNGALLHNGKLDITGLFVNNTAISGNGEYVVSGTMHNNNSITGDGNFTIDGFLNNNSYITGNGNYHIAGSVANQGHINGSGTTTVSGAGASFVNQENHTLTQNKLVLENGAAVSSCGHGLLIGSGGIDVGADSTLNINHGQLNMSAGALNLSASGAVLNLYNPAPHLNTETVTANVASLRTVAGSQINMDVFSDGNHDSITASGAAVLDGKLTVRAGVGTYQKAEFTLINASSVSGDLVTDINSSNSVLAMLEGLGNIEGMFIAYKFDADTNTIKITISGVSFSEFSTLNGLTFNQREAAAALDALSRNTSPDLSSIVNALLDLNVSQNAQKAALSELSPYFLANVLRPQINSGYRNSIYKRIQNYCPGCSNNGLWLEGDFNRSDFSGDENSIGNFKSSGGGAKFGVDRYFDGSDFMAGLFGSYNAREMKQNAHKADTDSFGFGVYGGLIKENWDFKGLFGLSFDSYDIKRTIINSTADINRTAKSDFNGLTFNADFETAYKIYLHEGLSLKPYAGIEGVLLSYDSFQETNALSVGQKVEGDNVFGSSVRLGLGLDGKKGRFGWNAGAQYSFIIKGHESELNTRFVDTSYQFKTRGAEIGRHVLGFNAALSYDLTRNLSIYANGSFENTRDYKNILAALGVRFAFGGCCDAKAAPVPPAQPFPPLPEETQAAITAAELVAEPVVIEETPAPAAGEPKKIAVTFFGFDKAYLTDESKRELQFAAEEIKIDETKTVIIVGHTDAAGPAAYNQKLSERRALSAYNYLKSLGVDENRIAASGKGEEEPVASNATREGRAQNRRVEVFVK